MNAILTVAGSDLHSFGSRVSRAHLEAKKCTLLTRLYWPPHVAAAWVATRDRNFVDQIRFDKPMRYLAVALALRAVKHNGLKSAGLPYKNSHDASLALRDATAEGSVQAIR